MKMKKIIAVVAGVALLASMAIVATGCSSQKKLIEDNKLQVALHTGYAGFELLDTETGDFYGYDIDVAKAIAKEMGVELVIHNMDFSAALSAVQSGNGADISISGITITDKRKEVMNFSDPYYDDDQAIVVGKSSKFTKENYESELNKEGVKIYVQNGTTGQDYAKEHFPNATVTAVEDTEAPFVALYSGQCDAVVQNDAPSELYLKSSYPTLKVIATIATGEQYGIAIHKDNSELLKEINTILAKFKADGTLDKLQEANGIKASA